mmetsp:Transcript_32774/g.43700  ORF Transcript_32774/g.43700 Transcript_32774/m.43700 type:complete len:382 (+) Transcript_32774:84-1229(+)
MFGLAAGLYDAYLAPAKISILLVGVDDAGKTALLERVKVTQFDSRPGGSSSAIIRLPGRDVFSSRGGDQSSSSLFSSIKNQRDESSSQEEGNQIAASSVERRKKSLFCPAPERYWPSANISGDDDVIFVPDDQTGTSMDGSSNSNGSSAPINGTQINGNTAAVVTRQEMQRLRFQNNPNQYVANSDLRKNAKMFPLERIRPTSGMNIGKVDMCGCKCRFWDLAGSEKMRPLWERYYADADAIVFVVDGTATKSKLEESRDAFFQILGKEVLDGVPILVFASKSDLMDERENDGDEEKGEVTAKGTEDEEQNAQEQSSSQRECLSFEEMSQLFELNLDGALETCHSITFRRGSAKTGEGVKAAFEWLIPRAKKMQKNRGRIP